MLKILPKSLIALAGVCPKPLYVVGGSVRDYLAGYPLRAPDWDICSPMRADEFVTIATTQGFRVQAVYQTTGTVKLTDERGVGYEFSCFRSDAYVRGKHTPVEIFFTEDMLLDARRRDFTANAVYYDIRRGQFVDPLGGIAAIAEKRLTTVTDARKVFSEDGLRLMRLARQAAQLGFTPDENCMHGATENAALIDDISPERVYAELSLLLTADARYGNEYGQYHGLKILEKTGVLARIFPELTTGAGMQQRPDFHDHDVLEHSLRAAKYAESDVRLAALLHDVGKPQCMLQDGNSIAHPVVGKRLAEHILQRLKAPKRVTQTVCALIEWHMYDFNCLTRENKLRKFFVEHYALLPELIKVKQADFSACKDVLSPAPTCEKWRTILEKMKREGAPFTNRQLAVNGNDLLALGLPPNAIASTLHALLVHAAQNPKDNEKNKLCRLALRFNQR